MSDYTQELFRQKHARPTRNVFLMMGFAESRARTMIMDTVRAVATPLQFDVIRADDYDYTGETWRNTQLCMDNCNIGIAILDGTRSRTIEPNIALELGYMFALRRRCLIVHDRGLDPLSTMLAHRLHAPFDITDIRDTLSPVIRRWLENCA